MIWRKIWGYIAFWRKGEKTDNFNLRMMHGINRISLLMFLVCIIVIIFRYFILR